MKVGVIGSGTVGQTLAAGFVKHGHEAMIGTRGPAKLADWAKANPKAKIGSFSETAKHCPASWPQPCPRRRWPSWSGLTSFSKGAAPCSSARAPSRPPKA